MPFPGPYLLHEKASWPILFLYSEKGELKNKLIGSRKNLHFVDVQIPWRYIDYIAEYHIKQGRSVIRHKFADSGHVAHLKKHPEQYKKIISDFVKIV